MKDFKQDPNEFQRLWNAAESPAEVAVKLGIDTQKATLYAHMLRRFGYDVKKFKPGFKAKNEK